MKKKLKSVAIVPALYALLASSMAFAGIDIQGLKASRDFDFTFLEGATTDLVLGAPRAFGDTFFVGQYSYIDHPLVQVSQFGTNFSIVDSLNSVELQAGVYLSPKILVSFDFPIDGVAVARAASYLRIGDTLLRAKFMIGKDDDRVRFALLPSISLPTGDASKYISTQSVGYSLTGAAEMTFGRAKVVANLGYAYSANALWYSIDTRNLIQAGLGLNYDIGGPFRIDAEVMGNISLPTSAANTTGEYYLGGKYVFNNMWVASAGASINGFGSTNNSLRVTANVKWAPFQEKPKIIPPEVAAKEAAIKERMDCGEEVFKQSYPARALTPEEFNKIEAFPYLSNENEENPKKRHVIPIVQLGQTNSSHVGTDLQATETVFAIDVKGLPPRSWILATGPIQLKMSLQYTGTKKDFDTEIFCFLDPKVCSGELYRDKNWLKNINPVFFGGKETPNDHYIRRYVRKIIKNKGAAGFKETPVELDLARLIENSIQPDALNMIYEKSDITLPSSKTLYMVIAGDTQVSKEVVLEVNLKQDTCLKKDPEKKDPVK